MAEQSGNNTGGTNVLTVLRPDEGDDLVVEIQAGQTLVFDFDLDDVAVSQSGSDILLTFPDGSQVTLVSENGFTDSSFQFSDGLVATESSLFGDNAGQQDGTRNSQDAQQVIEKPDAGQAVTVTVQPGEAVSFGFDIGDAEVLQSDSDIVLLFEDGSQITLQSVLSAAAADAPPLVLLNDGSIVTPDELLSADGGGLESLAQGLSDIAPASGPDGSPTPAPPAPGNDSQLDTGPLRGDPPAAGGNAPHLGCGRSCWPDNHAASGQRRGLRSHGIGNVYGWNGYSHDDGDPAGNGCSGG